MTVQEILGLLVAARSPNPPGDERLVAAAIGDVLRAARLPAPDVLARDPARPNLVVTIGSGDPVLLLLGHMDTVPPASDWRADPYRLSMRAGRLYGLGVADMKGSLAAMLAAGERLAARPAGSGTVKLVFTADEETGSAFGVRWLCERGLLAGDAAILAEPASVGEASWDGLYIGHRGSYALRLDAHGVPGHSGENRPAGERASFAFAHALAALTAAEPFADVAPGFGATRPLLNVATTVTGGETAWAHPATLSATLEVRTLPGMTEQSVLDALRRVVDDAGLADRVTIAPLSHVSWVPPAAPVPDGPLVEAARRAYAAVLGSEPELRYLHGCTDAAWLANAGIPVLPTLGPGSFRAIHQADEWIAAADLDRAVDLFERVALEFFSTHQEATRA